MIDYNEEELFDFLDHALAKGVSVHFELIRDTGGLGEIDKRYREGMRVQVFTVPSQFVYGKTLREAVNAAANLCHWRSR